MLLEGWTNERKALVLKVFSLIIEYECGVKPAKLLDLAEQYPSDSVAELIEKLRQA